MIVLKNIRKSYPNVAVLKGIDIEIPDNCIFGIIGRSGAGKSTLLRIASLLERPDEGEVYYDNDRVDTLQGTELLLRRRKMGMIFQNFNLFIILMILLIPLTRLIVKTSVGPTAALVPLSIAAAPFVARVVESALSEIDRGVITAAKAMGGSNSQIIYKVLIPETMPALVSGLALTIINLISYTAMAGAIGGRGLGDLAIRYGCYRFRMDVTIAAVIIILLLVEAVQITGTIISRHLLAKR